MCRIIHYRHGTESQLTHLSPGLRTKVMEAAAMRLEEQLTRARRARATPSQVEFDKYLSTLPRYTRLTPSEDLLESLPF